MDVVDDTISIFILLSEYSTVASCSHSVTTVQPQCHDSVATVSLIQCRHNITTVFPEILVVIITGRVENLYFPWGIVLQTRRCFIETYKYD